MQCKAWHIQATYTVRPCPAASQPLVTKQYCSAACTSSTSTDGVRQLIQSRSLIPVEEDIVVEEVGLVHQLLATSPGSRSTEWSSLNVQSLAERAIQLTDIMATGSVFRTLQMIKRHPQILELPPYEVANRVLQLKMVLPEANIADVLYQKPTLVLLDDIPGTLEPALKKLRALMPGIPVERKLHEGGTVWWSFTSLLNNKL